MILLHCADAPETLPADAIARWLARLPRARATSLARELEAGRGLDTLTGLALLVDCARLRSLPRLSQLATPPGGKPCWPEGPDFSIAHAAGRVACAVAPPGVAIGVDLEPEDGVRLKSLRLVTSAAERAQVQAGALSAAALWTCKEAVLKAAGHGIAAVGQVEIEGDVGRHADRDYHLERIGLAGSFMLAIATSVRVAKPAIHWVDASTLWSTA